MHITPHSVLPTRYWVPLAACVLALAWIPVARSDDYDNSQSDEQTLRAASLATDGPTLLEFFRKRTLTEFDKDKLATLVKQLGDKAPEVREKASGELLSLGSLAVPMLRQAAKDPDDQEVAARAKRCLQFLEGQGGPAIPVAAARLVAQRRPEGAAEVLLAYLPFADDDTVIEEIKSALAVVAVRDGKPDKALISALEDKVPIRRAVAVEALCQARGGEAVPSVIKLLQDPKPAVRLRAAVALANFREAKAVSTMVALLAELPVAQAKIAYEYLVALAGELGPKVELGTTEAARQKCRDAWAAWWQATEGDGSLAEFRKRTLTDDVRTKILTLIKQLGDDTFETREKASKELVDLGTAAVSLLRQAQSSADLEVSDRAKKCLVLIEKEKTAALPAAAARIVALRKPAGAAEALLAFMPFADDESIASEVLSALVAVGVREGKVDPALVKALDDKVAVRRIAAAEALCQAGVVDQFPMLRKMLADTDQMVQFRVAMALATARDRETVPPMIGLLGTLPTELGGQIEEYLRQLAGDKAPVVNLGSDKAAKEKCRDAWATWWKDNGAKVDMVAATSGPRYLGYTMIVFYETGQVVELGPDGKPRLTVTGLQYPFDAHVLPGDRVLVAEYSGRRVTERNAKGEIVWEKQGLNNPFNCQRLANGNTFIVTRGQIIEVDKAGKDAYPPINRQNQDIMAAVKMRDGQIIMIDQQGQCIRMDATGKEIKRFNVGYVSYGGLELISKNRILVSLINNNKVVEYDLDGKSHWEANVNQPTSAVRLPNGNTLVASYNSQQVYEVDKAGKMVHQFNNITSRPWRARKR